MFIDSKIPLATVGIRHQLGNEEQDERRFLASVEIRLETRSLFVELIEKLLTFSAISAKFLSHLQQQSNR